MTQAQFGYFAIFGNIFIVLKFILSCQPVFISEHYFTGNKYAVKMFTNEAAFKKEEEINEKLSESDYTIKAIPHPIEIYHHPMPIVELTEFNGDIHHLDFIGCLVWEYQPLGDLMSFAMRQACLFKENTLQWLFSRIVSSIYKLSY